MNFGVSNVSIGSCYKSWIKQMSNFTWDLTPKFFSVKDNVLVSYKLGTIIGFKFRHVIPWKIIFWSLHIFHLVVMDDFSKWKNGVKITLFLKYFYRYCWNRSKYSYHAIKMSHKSTKGWARPKRPISNMCV